MPSLAHLPLILASSSRYRVELLSRLRWPFSAISPDIDESPLLNETPEATAMRLAQAKALAIATGNPGTLLIGSDQVAELHGMPLGKPGNHANAVRQLMVVGDGLEDDERRTAIAGKGAQQADDTFRVDVTRPA